MRSVYALAATALMLTGFATLSSQSAAKASDGLTGICTGDTCWQVDASYVVDAESRDISGQPDQDWNPVSQGLVTSTWPFTVSTLDTEFKGDTVYEFKTDYFAAGSCALGDYDVVDVASCSDTGKLWVNDDGGLIAVFSSDYYWPNYGYSVGATDVNGIGEEIAVNGGAINIWSFPDPHKR
jgi:hypothetical protein